LGKKLVKSLDINGLRKKIAASIKNERSNFNTMIATLKLVVSCDVLGLEESFQGTCFGCAG
jgi:hypothetical protein